MKIFCKECEKSTKHKAIPRFGTWIFAIALFPIGLLLLLLPRKYRCKECKTVNR